MTSALRILIVDDETGLADLYAAWLEDDHEVETAYGGEEALETVDEETDIVLLDRRMPQVSGDEVLAEMRDRGLDCQVAMVTAVDADLDIVEMEFDEYLSKPVTEEDLDEVIGRLVRRTEYDDGVQRYFSLVSKRASLEATKTPEALRSNEEYTDLIEEIETLETELDDVSARLDDRDAKSFFSNL